MANFCVFGGAAKGISEQFVNDADTIGRMLAARGHRLTYGGGQSARVPREACTQTNAHGRTGLARLEQHSY